MQHYLIAHMIDKPEIGAKLPRLPLHMTIVHWFKTEAAPGFLENLCDRVASELGKFTAYAGEGALFGSDNDVPVSVIMPSLDITNLHQSLVAGLDALRVEHTAPRWVGDGFNAHVTHKTERRLHEGNQFLVDSIDLITAASIGSIRTVLARFELSDDYDSSYRKNET